MPLPFLIPAVISTVMSVKATKVTCDKTTAMMEGYIQASMKYETKFNDLKREVEELKAQTVKDKQKYDQIFMEMQTIIRLQREEIEKLEREGACAKEKIRQLEEELAKREQSMWNLKRGIG